MTISPAKKPSKSAPRNGDFSKKPLARAPRRAVNARAHVVEHFRHVPTLIQNDRRLHGIQEPMRLMAKATDDVRVLEKAIRRRATHSASVVQR